MVSMTVGERFGDDHERTPPLAAKGAENGFCLGVVVGSALHNLRALRRFLRCGDQSRSVGCGVWIEEDSNLRQVGHQVAQELNPLSRDSKIPSNETGDISAGPPKAFRNSKPDGIDHLGKHDWNCRRQLADSECRWQTLDVNDIGLERDEFGRRYSRFG